jgi:HEAT repeat protein
VRRTFLVVAGLTAAAGALWILVRRADHEDAPPGSGPVQRGAGDEGAESAGPRPRARTETSASSGAVAREPPVSGPDVAADLRAALKGDDEEATRAAAAALRRAARTDPARWDEAVRRLLDPSEDEAVREALALVIGTIDTPRTDAVLLEALRATGAAAPPEGLRRAILLALGATRDPPDKDDVFGLGDRPWGEDGPGGLGITVEREIGDGGIRAALAGALREGPEESRRAAAASLRHSLGNEDALAAFRGALRDEKADAPVAVVGEALAGVARRSRSAEEREALLRAIFARTGEEALDGLRFRITDDLQRVRLPADVTASLHELAESDRPFALRSFALDMLTGSATATDSGDDTEVRRTRDLLSRLVESAADPALRDLAARHLRKLPADAAGTTALLHALRTDAAWNVRYTALESIVALGGADVATALEAGKRDGDERVRALAAELAAPK